MRRSLFQIIELLLSFQFKSKNVSCTSLKLQTYNRFFFFFFNHIVDVIIITRNKCSSVCFNKNTVQKRIITSFTDNSNMSVLSHTDVVWVGVGVVDTMSDLYSHLHNKLHKQVSIHNHCFTWKAGVQATKQKHNISVTLSYSEYM